MSKAPEPEQRVLEVEDVLIRPGTYFNPQTEVLVVVDDSHGLDQEIFNMERYEGSEWVLISDEVPIDEQRRDELLEAFQTHYHAGGPGSVSATAHELDEDEGDLESEDEGGQEPGRED